MPARSIDLHADQRGATAQARILSRFAPLAGSVVAAVGVLVLIGWAIGHRDLQRVFVHGVTVKANTAIGLTLAAVAMLLSGSAEGAAPRRLAFARVLGALVAAIGLATLAQYVLGVDLHLDELLVRVADDAGVSATPGRMAPVTAFGFVLVGSGIAMLDVEMRDGFRPGSTLLTATVALGLTALLGFAYGAIPKEGLGYAIQIAMPTSISFVLLGIGNLALRPRVGWIGRLASPYAGGFLARRLIPFAFVVPLVLGLVRTLGSLHLQYSVATVSGIVAVATMLAFGFMIMRTSAVLDEADVERLAALRARVSLALDEETARSRAEAEHAARDHAERLLREKTEALTLLDVVIGSAPVAFALLDQQLCYLRVNAALGVLARRTPAECVGRRSSEIVPGLAIDIDKHVRQVLATSTPLLDVAYTLPGQSAASGTRFFLASYYPVRFPGGGLVGVGAFIAETTDRKTLETQLLQAQKMEAVGQLAGGIAHDFNNLLTVISSYATLVLESFDVEDARRHDVSEIQDASVRAAQLTRQLLAFSRKQVVALRSLDVNAVVADTEKMLRRLIGDDVVLSATLATNVHTIYADAGQLEQVLVNLAVNARDAMPDGGRLSIETANVVLSADYAQHHVGVEPGEYVMLAVSDTGIGMSSEVLAHVFEPFFTTKEVGRGTGLGLSTVYGIVKQFGGDVWVYSEPGHGTTFKIYLPRQVEATAEYATPKPAGRHAPRGETVLLVEDDARLRQLTDRVLRANGYVVLTASDGAAALSVAYNHDGPIHLILSDVVMPGMNGRDLIDGMSTARPSAKWLFMSGYTDDDVIRRGVFDHQTAFLEKPFTPEHLLAKVGEVLG
jgi:signal transduction histidine kinase/CheY-like chemotaxis protein